MTDYLATLDDVHPRHCGLLFEQIQQASLSAAFYLRAFGVSLPGEEGVPSHQEVYQHLYKLVNDTLAVYFETQKTAPKDQKPNEIWGYGGDDMFSISVTGLSDKDGDGYTSGIELNLLYQS